MGGEDEGLTNLGEELVRKLVSKKIAIDLSHANEKTFWDIVNVCRDLKEEGAQPILFASHSNSRSICESVRNLSDEQIAAICIEFDRDYRCCSDMLLL